MALTVKILQKAQRYNKIHNCLWAIPCFLTFCNAAFGLISIINSLEGNITSAAYSILLAALMDALDGRIARKLSCSTVLGSHLDSLSDAISFCVAPALMMYSWQLSSYRLGVIVAIIYVCAGLFRLARFNSGSVDSKLFFRGLSTPVAALVLASLIMHESWLMATIMAVLIRPYTIMIIMVVLALLMVSLIPFPAFKHKIRLRISRKMIFMMGMVIISALMHGYPLLGMILASYILGSLIYSILLVAKRLQVLKF